MLNKLKYDLEFPLIVGIAESDRHISPLSTNIWCWRVNLSRQSLTTRHKFGFNYAND
jgi:hypothetical protein